MNLEIIILAAGLGKRMYSTLPKVLHPLAGKPMLKHVLNAAKQLNPKAIHVIYGYQGEVIQKALPDPTINWVHQASQLGTGHAVMQALPHITAESHVLILYGDVPLIQANTLSSLIARTQTAKSEQSALALLVANLDNPTGLGRIVRNDQGEINTIVEEKDANMQEKLIKEIYTGICCAKASDLMAWLPQIGNENAQKEYYLTDIISLACKQNTPITSLTVEDPAEVQGVNDRLQLQTLERLWQKRNAEHLLSQGLGITDATRFDLRGTLTFGKDVLIDINCIFNGTVTLGEGSSIGPNCVLTNVTLGAGSVVYANSVIEGTDCGDGCNIGPFARLRAGTTLANHCKIGNFVETKKAIFGEGSKASHLSYLGDVLIGTQVNIGAGTITCNYDGVNKHQTIIEDGAFIGSDTQLVAPVTVGKNATIGAGSTIRRNAPEGELTLTESKQKTVYGWQRPLKKEKVTGE